MKKITFFASFIVLLATGCAHKITPTTTTATVPANEGTGIITIQPGGKYVVENKITTNSTSEMQGQSMETNADVTSIYNIEVNDVKGDNYNMTNKIAGIKMTMNTMGQNINFDSDKKEDMNGEMGSAFKDVINKPTPVVMDKSGTIINAEPDSTEADASSQAAMVLKQLGDPKAMGYGAKMAFLAIPKNAKTGTTWQDSTSTEGVTRVTNYTIKEINEDTATVTMTGTENRNVKMEMQGMEINTKTNGQFSGQQTVNIHTGIVYKNELDANATGTISVMGQDIPTKIKVTSATTVKPM